MDYFMEFFDNCTNDSVVFDALQHEYNKLLKDFRHQVHLCYEVCKDGGSMRNICQKTIRLRKKQLRKLKVLMDRIQSEWKDWEE